MVLYRPTDLLKKDINPQVKYIKLKEVKPYKTWKNIKIANKVEYLTFFGK